MPSSIERRISSPPIRDVRRVYWGGRWRRALQPAISGSVQGRRDFGLVQNHAAAIFVQRAIVESAATEVIDPIAVALIETHLRTEPPDGMLDHARKIPRKLRIDGARVDALRDAADDVGAAVGSVAMRPVEMISSKPP